MALATLFCRAQLGIEAPEVSVEVHLAGGLPALTIVGLPETAVRESKDRVRAALQNAGFSVPARKITVSLGPADLPKQGGRYDLAIALGILAASGQIPTDELTRHEFVAELSLSGALRRTPATLPAAMAAAAANRKIVVPEANAEEAAMAGGHIALRARHLLDVIGHLSGNERLSIATPGPLPNHAPGSPDLREIRGQHQARRALEIAATGQHNLLFEGPPGAGKTMLAGCLRGLLPPLSRRHALEVAAIRSCLNLPLRPSRRPPFRAPHHTASAPALVGGGVMPRPGEVSLAHRGVLLLDELPEFQRGVLEVLREPLEAGEIRIARAAGSLCFPARFQLIATMNPCPCGNPGSECRCSQGQIDRYRARISGPLLDRIDLQLWVPRVEAEALRASAKTEENSECVRQRIVIARKIAQQRQGRPNAALAAAELAQHCALGPREEDLLCKATERLRLSARAHGKLKRVARSIADLAGSERIELPHVSEALQYRDRTAS